MDYAGLRDMHLNVFVEYNSENKIGSSSLENNITKAFINTLDSLTKDSIKTVSKDLFGIDLPKEFDCKYYLQKSPGEDTVRSIPVSRRVLFAFSPTGKRRKKYSGEDTKNIKMMKKDIQAYFEQQYKDGKIKKEEIKNSVNRELEEIKNEHDKGSVPDAWIVFSYDNIPQFVVLMENKRHDLDPFQLNNHLEKKLCLSGEDKENKIIYKKYSEIVDCLSCIDTYMTREFHEYLIILGYLKVDNFYEAFMSDSEIRKKLSFPFGMRIMEGVMKKLSKDIIDERGKTNPNIREDDVWRIHVKYDYLKEINLIFKEDVYVSFALGSSQSIASIMYDKLKEDELERISLDMVVFDSFHLHYHRGKNIEVSRISKKEYVDGFDFKEYISYWRNNISLLQKGTPEYGVKVFEKMYKDKLIKKAKYEQMKAFFVGKKNEITVVPEIVVEKHWKYEDIAANGEEWLIYQIEKALNECLSVFA